MVPIDPDRPVNFEGRLLAETIRIYEGRARNSLDDETANAAGRARDGTLEEKIVCRAWAHPLTPKLLAALARFRWALKFICALALALAFSAGLATAHAALTAPGGRPVAFYWALLALLGLATLTLLAWIALSFMGRWSFKLPSLGGATLGITRRFVGWYDHRSSQTLAIQGLSEVLSQGVIGRWSLSAISHGLWGGFLSGALTMAVLILSARQVAFGWETTILSEAIYIPVTKALAALPEWIGFPTPTLAEITSSRWDGQGPANTEAAGAWAGLLIGSLLLYGLAPRFFFFAFSLVALKRALRGFRLDLMRPEYLRLRETLMPSHLLEKHVAADGTASLSQALPPAPLPEATRAGPFALLGLEIDVSQSRWPPDLKSLSCLDLGVVDSREDRKRVLAELSSSSPSLLLVAVSLLSTPDRGFFNTLKELQTNGDAPIILLLSDGESLARRAAGPARAQRYEDWRRLASELRIPSNWIIEIDLANPAVQALPELTALLQGDKA